MLTNKLLTLGLSALILTSTSALAGKQGAETGGGGDAVLINGKAVLRDVVLSGDLPTVENNIEFLKSIKGFKALIESIAKVNPDFAADIVIDLAMASIHLSSTDLPLLNYGITTMPGGVAADVQLADRTGNDIVIAPKFFENEYTKYTMIHEALHGLLSNNAGPAHHQRVRNIVNYLYTNRAGLTATGLNEVLKKNNYSVFHTKEKEIWNKNLDSTVRCHFALSGVRTVYVGLFEDLNCGSDILDRAVENMDFYSIYEERNALAEAKYPGISTIARTDYSLTKEFTPYVKELTLQKDQVFKSNIKSYQKSICWDNSYNKKKLVELKEKADAKSAKIETLEKSLDAASLTEEVKDKFVKSFDSFKEKGLTQIKSEHAEISTIITERLKTAEANEVKCQKQYPN